MQHLVYPHISLKLQVNHTIAIYITITFVNTYDELQLGLVFFRRFRFQEKVVLLVLITSSSSIIKKKRSFR